MPVPTIAGNWKMNTTVHEAARLATGVRDGLRTSSGVDIVLCPPFIALHPVRDAVHGSPIKVGAQNMHFEDSGAYTGVNYLAKPTIRSIGKSKRHLAMACGPYFASVRRWSSGRRGEPERLWRNSFGNPSPG